MAKLPVKTQLLFGGSLTPTGNIAEPGSTVGGSPIYSNDPAALQSLAAWLNGLAAMLENAPGGLSSPVLEEFNAIFYVITYQLAYLKQAGIPEWDPTVPYYQNSFCQEAGIVYVSKIDANTNNDPALSPSQWQTYASTLVGASAVQLKAWVIFDGRGAGATMAASYNVSSVNKVSAGIYDVVFGSLMTDLNYGFCGNAGTAPGASFSNGDDNIICGGVSGKVSVRTRSTCRIFCWDRPNNATEDSSAISLQFFGN